MYSDTDFEQAELDYVGDLMDAAHRAGVCLHTRVDHAPLPGQLACAGCGRVFATDDDWILAMDEAIGL